MSQIYISLGNDCSIAYQLQKHNLRHYAFPFDWIKSNNIDDIIYLLNNNFQFFAEKEHFKIVKNSDKFPLLDEKWDDNINNNIIIKHQLYNFTFPHEINYINDKNEINNQIENMCAKYKKRIKRFYDILKDDGIKKKFIRITHKKEIPDLFEKCIGKICNNFEVQIIFIDKKTKFSSWKKDELDWNNIFN